MNWKEPSTACLPSCRDQFSHQFNNGTGVRCWVAGWGKNEVDGSFQFIQHKVDLPLVENNRCNNKLKSALNQQRAGSGNRFSLSQSEICAGARWGKTLARETEEVLSSARDFQEDGLLLALPAGERRLHGRRRKSSRLPGTFRKMDCCWPCHLGGGMCQRCPWSLSQDVTFHSVDRPELNLFICMNNLIKRWEFLLIPEQ